MIIKSASDGLNVKSIPCSGWFSRHSVSGVRIGSLRFFNDTSAGIEIGYSSYRHLACTSALSSGTGTNDNATEESIRAHTSDISLNRQTVEEENDHEYRHSKRPTGCGANIRHTNSHIAAHSELFDCDLPNSCRSHRAVSTYFARPASVNGPMTRPAAPAGAPPLPLSHFCAATTGPWLRTCCPGCC